jgi:AcrR family transcriptional regulator
MPRTGRRPGASGSRDRILTAARTQFAETGWDATTIRGIAAGAGVDPALVMHYFGSKEGVFRSALEFPLDPAEVVPKLLAPGLEGLGERLVRFFIGVWDSPAGRPLLGVIRSAVASEQGATLLREFISREVLGRIAGALAVDQPRLRASLVGSQLVGLAMLRYVVKLEPLASAPVDTLAAWVGPTLQRYLTEGRPLLSRGGAGAPGGRVS